MDTGYEEKKGDEAISAIVAHCSEKDVVSKSCSILDLDLLTTKFISNSFQTSVKT